MIRDGKVTIVVVPVVLFALILLSSLASTKSNIEPTHTTPTTTLPAQ
jgi:hypothetical protein